MHTNAVFSTPPQPISLEDIEKYRMQMAGIMTAALGYWKEGDAIHPDYDTVALRDVAKLYAKYDALFQEREKATQPQPVAAEVEKDAARYRFLRMDAGIRNERPFIAISSAGGISQWTGIHADKQIDAAMAGTGSDESAKEDK